MSTPYSDDDIPLTDSEIENLTDRQVTILIEKIRQHGASVPEWWTKSHLEDLLGRDVSEEAWDCFRDWYHRRHREANDELPREIEVFDWDNPAQFVENH
jgi:hypothetical protein